MHVASGATSYSSTSDQTSFIDTLCLEAHSLSRVVAAFHRRSALRRPTRLLLPVLGHAPFLSSLRVEARRLHWQAMIAKDVYDISALLRASGFSGPEGCMLVCNSSV
jgi:hypothetical protein